MATTEPPTLLLLVRHGATQANVREPYVLQGLRSPTALIALGKEQARAAARALQVFQPSRVYCSPLRRARQTARLMAAGLGLPVAVERALAEVDTGRWTGLSWPEIQRRWPAAYRAFQRDAERHGYLGGENLAQVRDRALPAVESLVARHPGERIVVVSHGVVNRVLLAHWLGLPLRYARRLPQDNAAWNLVQFRGTTGQVRTVNAITHLVPHVRYASCNNK